MNSEKNPMPLEDSMLYLEALGDEQVSLILTLTSHVGLRVDEFKFVTVENVKDGRIPYNEAESITLSANLRDRLLKYAEQQGIQEGPIFPDVKEDNSLLSDD